MIRAAALLRVSTQKQARRHDPDEETLPVQRAAVRRFVDARPDWTLVREYAEEGVSAWSHGVDERTILQAVLADARHGAFDVLLVFKFDRLSRVSLEYPVLLSQLHRIGVRVYSVADDGAGRELKIDGQMDKLLRFVEGWQAETESYNTSVRVSAKMRQMAEKGIWTGGTVPYGYRLRPGGKGRAPGGLSLEVYAPEAEVVRRMFDWYLNEGLGSSRIAQRLNAQGYRRRNGKPWVDGSVREIMHNPIVSGRPAYGRTFKHPVTRRQNTRPHDAPEVVVAPAPVPELVIVPVELWEAAHRRMHAYNRRSRPGDGEAPAHSRAETSRHLLTGLLRCGGCGGPMTGISTMPRYTARDGGVRRYRYLRYICRNGKGGMPCPAPQRSYGARRVDGAVLEGIRQALVRIDGAEVAELVRERVRQDLWQRSTRAQVARRRLERAERLHQEWTRRLEAFLLAPQASLYPEAFLAERLREAEREREEARRELAAASREGEEVARTLERLEAFLSQARSFWERFSAAPLRERKRLLGLLIATIVVQPDALEIRWRIDLEQLAGGGGQVEWRESRPLARRVI